MNVRVGLSGEKRGYKRALGARCRSAVGCNKSRIVGGEKGQIEAICVGPAGYRREIGERNGDNGGEPGWLGGTRPLVGLFELLAEVSELSLQFFDFTL